MTERLDLFDRERTPLGKMAVRDTPLGENEYFQVSAIWTADGEGNILLTRRAAVKKYFPGWLENSGGAVLAGETPREAAARELFEETGIRVGPEDLLFLGTEQEEHYFADTFFLLLDEVRPAIRLQPEETADYYWVTLKELEELLPTDKIIPPAVRQLTPLLPAIRTLIREHLKKQQSK